jgi:hypothetical protein
MPVEQRKLLAKNLERFDKLDRKERDAIEALDRELQDADPTVRARYLSVMRRYHLWLRSLPEEKRLQVESAPPDQRLDMVVKLLKSDPAAKSANTVWTQSSALSPKLLLQQAYWIKIWFSLTPEERKPFNNPEHANTRLTKLEELGRRKGITAERAKMEDAMKETVARPLQAQTKLRNQYLTRKAAAKAERGRQLLDELLYVRFAHPAPVDPANLRRFANVIPSWIRESLDPLPPDAAKHRITLLYRMIYPEGEEIPPPPKVEPKEKPGPGGSKAAPGTSGTPAAPTEGNPF